MMKLVQEKKINISALSYIIIQSILLIILSIIVSIWALNDMDTAVRLFKKFLGVFFYALFIVGILTFIPLTIKHLINVFKNDLYK